VNDAGIGCDAAGVAGLPVGEAAGLAVAAVSHESARIGDGADTLASGVVSHVNLVAASCGVHGGMRAMDAAAALVAAHRPGAVATTGAPPAAAPARMVLADGEPPVIGLDSASSIGPQDACAIVVTGSHGGLVGGQPLRHRVLAAAVNDAGVGKDGAGIARLERLDELGIPGLAVSHRTARIGDAAHAYAHGRISHLNRSAREAGARPGQSVREATAVLAESLGPSVQQPRPQGDPNPCHR
jgi:hypothetical protein